NVPYPNLKRGRRLSPPSCCKVWQLKLFQREKYHSRHLRASPQGDGERGPTLTPDCSGLAVNSPFARAWACPGGGEPRSGTNCRPIGSEFRVPSWAKLEEGVPGFTLLCP